MRQGQADKLRNIRNKFLSSVRVFIPLTYLASCLSALCAMAAFSPRRSIQFLTACRITLFPPDSCSILGAKWMIGN